MNRRDWEHDPDAPSGAAAAYAIVAALGFGVALIVVLVVLCYGVAR